MKKVLFGLGVVAVLSFPIVSLAYDNDTYSNPQYKYVYPLSDSSLLSEIFQVYNDYKYGESVDYSSSQLIGKKKFNLLEIGEPQSPFFPDYSISESGTDKDLFYPLSVEEMNKTRGSFSAEMDPTNIDFLKYFHNLDEISVESTGIDFRPLENSNKLKYLEITGPIASFEFLNQITTLKELYINANNKVENYEDSTIKSLNDISFLNNLDNLNTIFINSLNRPFTTINLKKSMDKYVLVSPFILSKQFKNPEAKITSKTPGFTFEDDILTWDGITQETKELQISWEFKSNENGSFKFSGDSIIPINWID